MLVVLVRLPLVWAVRMLLMPWSALRGNSRRPRFWVSSSWASSVDGPAPRTSFCTLLVSLRSAVVLGILLSTLARV